MGAGREQAGAAAMTVLDDLMDRTEAIADAALQLCLVESPSDDLAALTKVTDLAAELGARLMNRAAERPLTRDWT